MKDTDKITLTLGQIKKLVKESKGKKLIRESLPSPLDDCFVVEFKDSDSAARKLVWIKKRVKDGHYGSNGLQRNSFLNTLGKAWEEFCDANRGTLDDKIFDFLESFFGEDFMSQGVAGFFHVDFSLWNH